MFFFPNFYYAFINEECEEIIMVLIFFVVDIIKLNMYIHILI